MSVYNIDCDLKLTWQQVLIGAARLDDDGNIVLAVSGSDGSGDTCVCPWILSGTTIYNDPLTTNVGIGIAVATQKLHVVGNGLFTTGVLTPKIYPSSDSTTAVQILKADGTTPVINVDTTNGFVGFGTNAPVSELQVVTARTTSPRGIMSAQYNTGTEGARFHMRKGRGTLAAPTTVVTGDMLGRLVASGYDGTNYLEMAAIEMSSTGTIGTNRVPTKMSFWTATDAAPSVLTERMTILANGNVGIGNNNPVYGLTVSGTFSANSGIAATPYMLVAAAATGFRFLNSGGTTEFIRIDGINGNVGFGTNAPTQIISLSGQAARKIWMERHTTANTAGNTLTLEAGGATVGATDKDGGNQIISSGIATGTGKSDVVIKTVTNGATGTTDRTATDKMQVLGRSLVDNTQAGSAYDAGSYIDITPGTSGGMGYLMIGDAEEYAWFMFTSAAVVTLITYSANVVSTNTDAKFCVVDNGATVRIANALGATKTMSGYIIYNQ